MVLKKDIFLFDFLEGGGVELVNLIVHKDYQWACLFVQFDIHISFLQQLLSLPA